MRRDILIDMHPRELLEPEYCPKCGAINNEWVLGGLSFCWRCAECGTDLIATSWEPMLANWHVPIRLYRDGDTAGKPVLEGIASQLHDKILMQLRGTSLVLRFVER